MTSYVQLEVTKEGIKLVNQSTLLVRWEDIQKHMIRKPQKLMKLDVKTSGANLHPPPILFEITGMTTKRTEQVTHASHQIQNSLSPYNIENKVEEIDNAEALETLRNLITLIVTGVSFEDSIKSIKNDIINKISLVDSSISEDNETLNEKSKDSFIKIILMEK